MLVSPLSSCRFACFLVITFLAAYSSSPFRLLLAAAFLIKICFVGFPIRSVVLISLYVSYYARVLTSGVRKCEIVRSRTPFSSLRDASWGFRSFGFMIRRITNFAKATTFEKVLSSRVLPDACPRVAAASAMGLPLKRSLSVDSTAMQPTELADSSSVSVMVLKRSD